MAININSVLKCLLPKQTIKQTQTKGDRNQHQQEEKTSIMQNPHSYIYVAVLFLKGMKKLTTVRISGFCIPQCRRIHRFIHWFLLFLCGALSIKKRKKKPTIQVFGFSHKIPHHGFETVAKARILAVQKNSGKSCWGSLFSNSVKGELSLLQLIWKFP